MKSAPHELLAKLKEEDGFCAIQCKFFAADGKITLKDLRTFFTAWGEKYFMRRLNIDSTKAGWTVNAEEALYAVRTRLAEANRGKLLMTFEPARPSLP